MTVLLFNCFKLFDNSFPTCFHTKLCRWKLVYRIRMYANAIQVSKCLKYTVSVHNICMAILSNILYQETAVCAVCRCIESMIYMHWLQQTVWSGEMTIIRANCKPFPEQNCRRAEQLSGQNVPTSKRPASASQNVPASAGQNVPGRNNCSKSRQVPQHVVCSTNI